MKTDVKTTFGRNFKKLLSDNGITQIEIAQRLSVNSATLQRWIKGQAIPNPENLDLLAEYLGIEVSEFFIRDVVSDFLKTEEEYFKRFPKNNGRLSSEFLKHFRELEEKYYNLGDEESITQDYATPLGKVLPRISHYVLELLKLTQLRSKKDERVILVCLLLQDMLGDSAIDTKFNKLVLAKFDQDELQFWKKKLAKHACALAGLQVPSQVTSLSMKIHQLNGIELNLIESSIDALIAKNKKNKSVS